MLPAHRHRRGWTNFMMAWKATFSIWHCCCLAGLLSSTSPKQMSRQHRGAHWPSEDCAPLFLGCSDMGAGLVTGCTHFCLWDMSETQLASQVGSLSISKTVPDRDSWDFSKEQSCYWESRDIHRIGNPFLLSLQSHDSYLWCGRRASVPLPEILRHG